MGCRESKSPSGYSDHSRRESLVTNKSKNAVTGVKIHALITESFDLNNEGGDVPLRLATDQELIAEVARRKLDIVASMTDSLVNETYIMSEPLGSGASGQVFLATHRASHKKYACKKIKKDNHMNDLQSMITEVEILKTIRHRYIVNVNEIYESSRCQWIILELVTGGSLHDFVLRTNPFTEEMGAKLVEQMLLAIQYIHSQGIVHRDLKLDNILVQGQGPTAEIKITDFGLSALCGTNCAGGFDGEDSVKRKKFKELNDMWGTKENFAPELIDRAYGPQVDMWCMGCVTYQMLAGDPPFPPSVGKQDEIYERIHSANYNKYSTGWSYVSAEAKRFIETLFVVDPVRRASPTEALRDPWVTGAAIGPTHRVHLEHGIPETERKRKERKANKS